MKMWGQRKNWFPPHLKFLLESFLVLWWSSCLVDQLVFKLPFICQRRIKHAYELAHGCFMSIVCSSTFETPNDRNWKFRKRMQQLISESQHLDSSKISQHRSLSVKLGLRFWSRSALQCQCYSETVHKQLQQCVVWDVLCYQNRMFHGATLIW